METENQKSLLIQLLFKTNQLVFDFTLEKRKVFDNLNFHPSNTSVKMLLLTQKNGWGCAKRQKSKKIKNINKIQATRPWNIEL